MNYLIRLCCVSLLIALTLALSLPAGDGVEENVDHQRITFDHYRHYDELMELFTTFASKYPQIARTGSIGNSTQGRRLAYIELSLNVNAELPAKPRVKLVGNMHGDETVGREILVNLAEHLLYTYQTDERSRDILANTRLFLMPSINPDGFEAAKEGHCSSLAGYVGRKNANGVDLNRNFPDQFDSVAVRKARRYEKETRAMMAWIEGTKFTMSANFHAGSEVASYPFDSIPKSKSKYGHGVISRAPDDDFFKLMAHTYADGHSTMHVSEKKCGEDFFKGGVTNGAGWYNVPGGMQDFNYLNGNCMEITLELTCCKYPAASQLQREWTKNKEALLSFVELANKGVRGFVKDTRGRPIENAIVAVDGITKNITTDVNGDYYRLLTGTDSPYTLRVYKDGFKPSDAIVIDVPTDGGHVMQNVVLEISDARNSGK